MKTTLLFTIVSIGLLGCSATNLVTMSVQEPAPVTMPKHLKKIGVVNRSNPSEKNKNLDKIDQILSIEGLKLDKEGATECISGASVKLQKNERFTLVKELTKADLRGPGGSVFPSALNWGTVQKLCSDNGVDGLMVLEYYDTDSKVAYKTQNTMISGPGGIKIPAIEHHATINTLIKTGWRIYDPVNKVLVDEWGIDEGITAVGKGINPIKAFETIANRKEGVKTTSNRIGKNYAARILPYWIRVSRDYYVRGTDNFQIAKRKAQTGNWDGAAELWLKDTEHPDHKVKGRAYYNMAIINEINGDLDAAVDWASQSYEDYGNKLAIRYVRVLKKRKARQSKLRSQQQK